MNGQEKYHPSYEDIDEELVPMSELVNNLVNIHDSYLHSEDVELIASSLEIEMPIEVDVLAGDEGVIIGSAPPTQTVETSFMPVFHQVKLIITKD